MVWHPRWLTSSLQAALDDTPIVVLQGARQVGKSSLVQRVAENIPSEYLTLDDAPTLAAAHHDPQGFLARSPQRLIIIDEAQRCPELVLAMKANVDADRRPARFLVTGSADILRVSGVADS